MPLPLAAPVTKTLRRQAELYEVTISVRCDGTTNSVVSVTRRHKALTRDETNAASSVNEAPIVATFALADFGAQVQAGLTNFINALDVKPAP